MSQCVLLRSRYCLAVSERWLLKRCVTLLGQRVYHGDTENRQGNEVSARKRPLSGKVLRERLIRDIRHTKERMEEVIERENIWTVPNFLCIGRILTSPYLGYLIISQDYQVEYSLIRLVSIFCLPRSTFSLITSHLLSPHISDSAVAARSGWHHRFS